MIGVAISGVLFALTRHFAGPKPRTLAKEYEEATNEYFKVNLPTFHSGPGSLRSRILTYYVCRRTRSSPSPATAAKATRAKAKYRVRLDQRSNSALSTRQPDFFPLEHLEACREDYKDEATGWRKGVCILGASLYRACTKLSITADDMLPLSYALLTRCNVSYLI